MSPVARDAIQVLKLDTDSKEYIMGIQKTIENQSSVHNADHILQVENAESKTTHEQEHEDSGYIELL